MRTGASWHDVCILNISARGLLLQAAAPPERGTYLEVRRGQHEILARVVWSKNQRFGVRTQDVLAIDEIIRCADQPAPAVKRSSDGVFVDRRTARRSTAQRHEDSRMLSRAIEFGVLGLFAASAAVATFGTVSDVLHQPLAKASAALAPPEPRDL